MKDLLDGVAMCDRQGVKEAVAHETQWRPLAIDLFAGAGGMSLGFEQAGFDVVAAVEYDPVHAATHAYNFPPAEVLCRDAAALTGVAVMEAARRGFQRMYPDREWPGRVDAVVGGPPCQGFSTGGKREAGDERNGLLVHFARLVVELAPTVVCLENVAGLLEARFEGERNRALGILQDAGYALSGTSEVVNCADFGVPQRRRRVIVLGIRGDAPPGRPKPVAGQVTVAEALAGLPRLDEYSGLLSNDRERLHPQDLRQMQRTESGYARQLLGLEAIPNDIGYDRARNLAEITGARRTVHEPATVERFAETARGAVEPKSRLYRLPLDGPSRTLRAGTGAERGAHTSPRPIHPTESRVITVREAARLHGYPDWFRFHSTNWHGHRQVGNSVPPPMARAAAAALLSALGVAPAKPDRCFVAGDEELLRMPRSKAQQHFDVIPSELPRSRLRMPAR